MNEEIQFDNFFFLIFFYKVRFELQSQIDRFQSLMGRKPEHIDGHQHAHLLPGKLLHVTEHISGNPSNRNNFHKII